jgi:hypothetical protein
MISYAVYKLIHVAAILVLFTAVGGVIVHAANGGRKGDNAAGRLTAIAHGVALFFILLGGFGMLARLGVKHDWLFPPWLWGKLLIWVLLAFAVALPYRKPGLAKLLLLVTPLVGALAAFLAIFKPS